MQIQIRPEEPKDYDAVEMMTRDAFWNLYIPGGVEHYLVHMLRKSPDFIPELDLVATIDDKIVANIMFTKSYILSDDGTRHETLTFGPVTVLPEYQKRGIGQQLIKHAAELARKMSHKAILIYGFPDYYKRLGFIPAKEFNIRNGDGKFPAAHQVLELYDGALDGISGMAFESPDMNISEADAEKYDEKFPPKKKQVTPNQKLFNEMVVSFL